MPFDPIAAWHKVSHSQLQANLIASLLLALAFSTYYICFGRVYSPSQMFRSLLHDPRCNYSRNSLIVVAGIIFVSALVKTFYYEHIINFHPYDSISYLQSLPSLRLIVAGLLVGFGAQYASRSCEEDGLFGTPRFNWRSLTAFTVTYMVSAATTTWHFQSWIPKTPKIIDINLPANIFFSTHLLIAVLVPFVCFLLSPKKSFKGLLESLLHFVIGISVGLGYMLLRFSKSQVVGDHLNVTHKWNPSCFFVFLFTLFFFAIVSFAVKYLFKKPLFAHCLLDRKNCVDWHLVIGCMLVGLGFGLGKVSFETFLINVPVESLKIPFFWGIPCLFAMKSGQVFMLREGCNEALIQ